MIEVKRETVEEIQFLNANARAIGSKFVEISTIKHGCGMSQTILMPYVIIFLSFNSIGLPLKKKNILILYSKQLFLCTMSKVLKFKLI